MTYTELANALRTLNLGEHFTWAELRARHRKLVKRFHPDSGYTGDPQAIRRINDAYRLVSAYVSSYRFSFTEVEFYDQNPEERVRQQFMDDPLWGKGAS
jgi:hypothetical protein